MNEWIYLPLIEKASGKIIGDTNNAMWTSIERPEKTNSLKFVLYSTGLKILLDK